MGADANAKDDNGYTALMLSGQLNNADTIKLLLDHKVDVDTKNNEGKTALDIAGESNIWNKSRNQEIIKLLEDAALQQEGEGADNDTAVEQSEVQV